MLPRATEHIPAQIEFIADLERKGYTYRTVDGIYFDTSRQADYGYLARLDKAGLEAGRRVDLGDKRSATDFALWKFSPEGSTRQMEWDSPWGKGFPGWHIECSAMAQHYLGDYFDIHCGGEDHIPVHHTNEIAQTEARVGHAARQLLDARLFPAAERCQDGQVGRRVPARAGARRPRLRPAGVPLPVPDRALPQPAQLHLGCPRCRGDGARPDALGFPRAGRAAPAAADEALIARFTAQVNDDLNLPRALAIAWETLRGELPGPVRRATLARFDQVFGLGLEAWRPKAEAVPEDIDALARERLAARKAKNWAEADRLRALLRDAGWDMEDRPDGYTLKRR